MLVLCLRSAIRRVRTCYLHCFIKFQPTPWNEDRPARKLSQKEHVFFQMPWSFRDGKVLLTSALECKMIDKYQFGSNKIGVLLIQKSNPKIHPNLPPEICSLARDDLRVHQLPFNWDSPWVLGVHKAAPNLNFLRFFGHHDLGKSRNFWANKRCLVFFPTQKLRWKVQIGFWYQFTRTVIQKNWWFLSFAKIQGSILNLETWSVPTPSQFGLMIPICDLYITEECMDLKSLAFFAASFLALSSAFGLTKRYGATNTSNKSNIIRTTTILCFKICN